MTENDFIAAIWANRKALERIAYRMCRNTALAEDIAQETFCRAWQARDSYRAESSLMPWLVVIMRNLLRDHYRLHRNRFEVQYLAEGDMRLAVDDAHIRVEAKETLAFVERLRPAHRNALLALATGDDEDCFAGLTASGARNRVFKARNKLREAMNA